MEIRRLAKELGAVAAGVATAKNLIERDAIDLNILPSAKSVVVIACGHSRAALGSNNLQVKQNDTIATYEKAREVSKQLRFQVFYPSICLMKKWEWSAQSI